MRRSTLVLLLMGGLLSLSACGGDDGGGTDAGVDGGRRDGSVRDSGTIGTDSGSPIDGGAEDSGSSDEDAATATDAGTTVDSGSDAGAEETDAGPSVPTALNVNGGFEEGNSSGWSCNGNAMCTVTDADSASGTYAGQAINVPNDYSGFRINVLPLVCPDDASCRTGDTLLGRTLRVRARVKALTPFTSIRLVMRWNCVASDVDEWNARAGWNNYEWVANRSNPPVDEWITLEATFQPTRRVDSTTETYTELLDCDYGGMNNNLYLYTGAVADGTAVDGGVANASFLIDDLSITVEPAS